MVADLISDNLRRDLSFTELARQVNLSPSRLRHLFKVERGISPAQYLRLLRVRKAQELIETTFLSVKEIRSRVGFDNKSRFARNFKQVYGVTSAQYKASWHLSHRSLEVST